MVIVLSDQQSEMVMLSTLLGKSANGITKTKNLKPEKADWFFEIWILIAIVLTHQKNKIMLVFTSKDIERMN